MKIKSILTAIAVALSTLVHPVLASNWTFDKNGEPTHYKGIPIPPIQTVEQARAATEKRLAAIHAEEAKQAAEAAAEPATRDTLPNTAPQELFFTGKPYLEETGQYLFLFRHYDPELARWTTADPSGFPDGANNIAYMAVPTSEFDWQGLFKHQAIDDALDAAINTALNMAESNFASSVISLSNFSLGSYAYLEASLSNIWISIRGDVNVIAQKKMLGLWWSDNQARNKTQSYGGTSISAFGFQKGTYEEGMELKQNVNGSASLKFTAQLSNVTFDPEIYIQDDIRMLGINNVFGEVAVSFHFNVNLYE